jgi:hypothetical protein
MPAPFRRVTAPAAVLSHCIQERASKAGRALSRAMGGDDPDLRTALIVSS